MKSGIKFLSFLMAFALLTAMLCPLVCEAVSVDPNQSGSITLHYKHEDEPLSEIHIKLWKAGDVDENGNFSLCEPFTNYSVDITNMKDSSDWNQAASALAGYAQSDSLNPDSEGTSDENGKFSFSGIKPGLYLIASENKETADKLYRADPFLISVPSEDDNNKPLYDLDVYPKTDMKYLGGETDVIHTVIKKWEGTDSYPESVVIQVLKDSEVYTTQTLNAENDWKYEWTWPEDGSEWKVAEKDVPDGYTVAVKEEDDTFTVTNTKKAVEDPVVPTDPGTNNDPGNNTGGDSNKNTNVSKTSVTTTKPTTSTGLSYNFYTKLIYLSAFGLIVTGLYELKHRSGES